MQIINVFNFVDNQSGTNNVAGCWLLSSSATPKIHRPNDQILQAGKSRSSCGGNQANTNLGVNQVSNKRFVNLGDNHSGINYVVVYYFIRQSKGYPTSNPKCAATCIACENIFPLKF